MVRHQPEPQGPTLRRLLGLLDEGKRARDEREVEAAIVAGTLAEKKKADRQRAARDRRFRKLFGNEEGSR